MSRPFGVALLMAGYDQRGPQLYFSDPSGTYCHYKAKAIGAGSEGAQVTLATLEATLDNGRLRQERTTEVVSSHKT